MVFRQASVAAACPPGLVSMLHRSNAKRVIMVIGLHGHDLPAGPVEIGEAVFWTLVGHSEAAQAAPEAQARPWVGTSSSSTIVDQVRPEGRSVAGIASHSMTLGNSSECLVCEINQHVSRSAAGCKEDMMQQQILVAPVVDMPLWPPRRSHAMQISLQIDLKHRTFGMTVVITPEMVLAISSVVRALGLG